MSYYKHFPCPPPPGPLLPLPLPLPPPPECPPAYLFHYTDEYGMKCIAEERFIRPSLPSPMKTSPFFGVGVYLTSIPPSAPNHVILSNNWNDDGLASSYWNLSKIAKLQYCFIIPTSSLCPWELFKMYEKNGRDIWVFRGPITLFHRDIQLIKRWW